MLVFQNSPDARLALPGIVVTPKPLATNSAKFVLSFNLGERYSADGIPKGIAGAIFYRTDLFERSTVEGLSRRLVHLLEAVAADSTQSIGRLELLSPEERHQLLEQWNQT